MDDIAISVCNLSKKYHLYDSPKDRMKEALHPFRKRYHREFWALRDISFEIKKGETVGIVGKNGCGKSTLLKIICGVLTPTAGEVSAKGRISALLELGAGFNPEFTGLENVYFFGSLTGHSRKEMEAKMDDILSFADIGEFVDQPVKTYSSGMVVRLAFAAAINVDPDILVVDEALSVGDIRFQRKCYSKIEDFKNDGKTILFVTHSTGTIDYLCSSAILVDNGLLLRQDAPRVISKLYQQLLFGEDLADSAGEAAMPNGRGESDEKDDPGFPVASMPGITGVADTSNEQLKQLAIKRLGRVQEKAATNELRHGSREAEIIDFGIFSQAGKRVNYLTSAEEYTFFSRVLFYKDFKKLFLAFVVRDVQGIQLFYTNTEILQIQVPEQKRGGILEARTEITMWLAPGEYFLSFVSMESESSNYLDRRLDAFQFTVTSDSRNGGGYVNLNPRMKVNNIR